jgi:hypothetical protein
MDLSTEIRVKLRKLSPRDRHQRILARLRRERPLKTWVRIALFLLGWLLFLVGIVGLFVPVLQGGFILIAAAAVLSLVSELAYVVLRRSLSRWPRAWRRVATWRRRLRERLVRWTHRHQP